MRCCTCVPSLWRQHLDNRRCTIDADPLRSVGHRDVRARRMWVRDVIRPRRKHSQYFSATPGERKRAPVTSPAAFWTAKVERFSTGSARSNRTEEIETTLAIATFLSAPHFKHLKKDANTNVNLRLPARKETDQVSSLQSASALREMTVWIFRCVVRTEIIFSFMNSVFKEHVRPQRTVTQKQTSLQLQ